MSESSYAGLYEKQYPLCKFFGGFFVREESVLNPRAGIQTRSNSHDTSDDRIVLSLGSLARRSGRKEVSSAPGRLLFCPTTSKSVLQANLSIISLVPPIACVYTHEALTLARTRRSVTHAGRGIAQVVGTEHLGEVAEWLKATVC